MLKRCYVVLKMFMVSKIHGDKKKGFGQAIHGFEIVRSWTKNVHWIRKCSWLKRRMFGI